MDPIEWLLTALYTNKKIQFFSLMVSVEPCFLMTYGTGFLIKKWFDRKIISKVGVWLAGNLTKVSDLLSGYFVLKREVLNEMKLTSPGYKILLEILVKGRFKKIKEIPFRFRTREHSVSKLDSKEYMLFLKQLVKFYWMKRKKGVDY